MSDAAATTGRSRFSAKALVWAAVGVALLLLLMANAHLVYTAITSQPDCVEHLRQGEGAKNGKFSAARSSCTPH